MVEKLATSLDDSSSDYSRPTRRRYIDKHGKNIVLGVRFVVLGVQSHPVEVHEHWIYFLTPT